MRKKDYANKKIRIILVVATCVLFLTGCWDYMDVEKRTLFITVGISKDDDKSTIFAETAGVVGTTEDDPITHNHIKGTGSNFDQARLRLDISIPYQIFLGMTRVVLFNEKYAEEGIESYLNRIDELYDYRKSVLLAISREPIDEIHNIEIKEDITSGFLIEDIMNNLTKNGSAIYTKAGEALNRNAMGDVGYLLPYIGIIENKIKYLGLCVMKDSKMIDIIEVDKTDGIVYLLNNKPQLSENLPHPKDESNLLLYFTSVSKKKIETEYIDEQIVINIELNIGASLRGQDRVMPITEEDTLELEEKLSKKIKDDIEALMDRSTKECKCDFFEFVQYFRIQNPEIYRKIDWEEEYPYAEINVEVKAKIIDWNLRDSNAVESKNNMKN